MLVMQRVARKTKARYETMADALMLFREHPERTTAEIAAAVGMSRSRFEHAFTEWVGTTPKRYRNYLKTREVQERLVASKDILRSTYASGLKSPARLNELLVTYEAVTPKEFKAGDVTIFYGIHPSPFGHCLIAATDRGICQIAFMEEKDHQAAKDTIAEKWPEATVVKDEARTRAYAERIFAKTRSKKPFHLLIKGTNFQIKVWEALLRIPEGQTSTYAAIAKAIGKGKAVRAVGTACGKNAIALLIPCHRVLASSGSLGGYRWGLGRKRALLAREG
jgi:AraC family transcriptional regulator, regulatory protein of adaptative response / methylated-DNA-[protein]-cysteine methyltransferase